MVLTVLETPHVLLGAAIAAKVSDPILAMPLALMSHFVLDVIPHWNPHFYTETQKNGRPSNASTTLAIVDTLVALSSGLLIAASFLPDTKKAALVIVCCLLAVIPDQVKVPFYFLKKARSGLLQKWVVFERSLQSDASPLPGILTQVGIVVASLWWILKK